MGSKGKKRQNKKDDKDTLKRGLYQDMKRYFNRSDFSDSLPLTSNGVLSFHWANCEMTCDLQKEKIEHSALAKQKLQLLEEELQELKNWKIWMKCKASSIECSLYDLYESYLDPRMRINWFNRQDEILVSLHNEAGPFVALSSMRWIDKDIYTLFVYRKILTGHMTKRDFRLSLDVPMQVYFDDKTLEPSLMTMCQASRNGVLIKINGQKDLNKLLASKQMSFRFNSRAFYQSEDKEAPEVILNFSRENFSPSDGEQEVELKLDKEILRLYGNYENMKSSDGKSYYLFVKYEDFVCQGPQKNFTHAMRSMVETLEKYLKESIAEIREEEIQKVDRVAA